MLNEIPDTRTSKELNGTIFLTPNDSELGDNEIDQIDFENDLRHESIDISERRKSLPLATKLDSISSVEVPKRNHTIDMGKFCQIFIDKTEELIVETSVVHSLVMIFVDRNNRQ